MKIVLQSQNGNFVWELPDDIAKRFENTDAMWETTNVAQLGDAAKAFIIQDLTGKITSFIDVLATGLRCERPSDIMGLVDTTLVRLSGEAKELTN